MPVIQSIHRLESLRDDWNALADLQACPLLRHEWILAAARTLHAPSELRIVVQTDGEGRLTAVAPLARIGWMTGRLGMVGGDSLGEPMRVLAADQGALAALYKELFSLRVPLVFQRIATDRVEMAEMERAARQRGGWVSSQTAPWLGVEFAADPGTESMPWSRRLRYDLRRAHAKATAYGSVTVEEHAPDPAAAQEALDIFVRVETCGWKGRRGSSLATHEPWRLFFRAYSILAAEAGILRFSFLRVGQRVAAAQMSVEAYRVGQASRIDQLRIPRQVGGLGAALAADHPSERQGRLLSLDGARGPWCQYRRWPQRRSPGRRDLAPLPPANSNSLMRQSP